MTLNLREFVAKSVSTPQIRELLEQLDWNCREGLLNALDEYSDNQIVTVLRRMGYDTEEIEL